MFSVLKYIFKVDIQDYSYAYVNKVYRYLYKDLSRYSGLIGAHKVGIYARAYKGILYKLEVECNLTMYTRSTQFLSMCSQSLISKSHFI